MQPRISHQKSSAEGSPTTLFLFKTLPSVSLTQWKTIFLPHYIKSVSKNCQISFQNTPLYCYSQRRQWHPTPVLLPGKSHGQRSLVGCSPWGREESDTTERLHFHFSLSCIGEGNGNPLQCSCLENPRDGGAWWAAVYGVAPSRTRLKRLSSSSSSTDTVLVNPNTFIYLFKTLFF